MSRVLIVIAALSVAGCGGGSPTGPGPNPNPTTVTVSGRVLTTVSGDPVVGAALNFSGRTVTTAANGQWNLDGQAMGATVAVEVSAPGYLTRNTRVRTEQGRSDVVIDLIRDGAPFSLDFYRQFVRGGLTQTPLEPLRRWTRAPRFYIDTRNPATGAELTESERALIAATIQNAVPQATGGMFSAASIEFGSGSRTQAGYVEVRIGADTNECGRATIGADPGWIQVNYGGCVALCGGQRISANVITHELGHAMGFWHTPSGMMTTADAPCQDTAFSQAELHHARIAYARPVGSLDVDRDGENSTALSTATAAAARVVSCGRR